MYKITLGGQHCYRYLKQFHVYGYAKSEKHLAVLPTRNTCPNEGTVRLLYFYEYNFHKSDHSANLFFAPLHYSWPTISARCVWFGPKVVCLSDMRGSKSSRCLMLLDIKSCYLHINVKGPRDRSLKDLKKKCFEGEDDVCWRK